MQFSDGSIGKPGKGLRYCSACVGSAGTRRSTANSPCDQLFTCFLSCLLTWLTPSVCPLVSVMHFVNLATRNLRTHRSSFRLSMLSLLRTTDRASGQLHGIREQQAGEEVLVRSDHPARGRATKRLTSCPPLKSHDRTLGDASSSSGRQAKKKCSEAVIARPLVAERYSNPKFGLAIFEYSRPAVSRNESNFRFAGLYCLRRACVSLG